MKTRLILIAFFILSVIACRKTFNPYSNPGDPDYFYNRPVGASANELLSDTKYKSLKLEIQYMPGFEPSATSISHVQNLLASILRKPSGISIVTREIAASASLSLSTDQVHSIEKSNRTVFTTGDQIGVYLLITNGNSTNNNVLGAAYRNTSMVLFGKTIHDNSGGFGQPSRTKLESTVMDHEIGHILGLVDIGSPMQTNHKDPSHSSHCNNSNCLMYYASDTRDILGFLITGNIPAFDANCMADLRANGGQ